MSQDAIAIIGLDVRFPGAEDADAFWRNLRAGVESTTFFTDGELAAAGVDPALLADPRYVKANGVLRGAADFDAAFFGLTPREAEITDPQHRVLLELAWTALENAGCDPARFAGRTGVFAGTGMSTYLLRNLAPNRALVESVGEMALTLGNNKDFAPTRISYKLDLRGPSVAVNTACSTSLVAVHLACQSLLDYQCDLALAGGASIQVPQEQGYRWTEGGIGSPDGRCRAFDARARGTVGGNGAGIVVLKRLADALAGRDTIRAVIRGSAVNNDGAAKVGFTAPGVEGQAQVIAEALAVAGVEPRQITYLEAHGTGTELGDPIEVAALTEAFRGRTADRGFCALGSVKTNFGHLDEAAGIAGLVKTVLALEHRELPPSLHFTAPNPKIDFAAGPFYVNGRLSPWDAADGGPRRAGVSSFGIGGTNAHVVVEEAPAVPPPPPADAGHVLLLAARTPAALDRMARRLADFLEARPDVSLADVAYTLALGRREFEHRRFVVARDGPGAAALLRGGVTGPVGELPPAVAALAEAARAWSAGGRVDWGELFANRPGRRIALPTYPFERSRYWIDAPAAPDAAEPAAPARKRSRVGDWFYAPSWRRAPAAAHRPAPRTILWIGGPEQAGPAAESLRAAGHRVEIVSRREATPAAWAALVARVSGLTDVVHAWNAAPGETGGGDDGDWAGVYPGVLALVQALGKTGAAHLTVLATHAVEVSGDEALVPARAALLGLCRVAAQEFPALACRLIDVTGLAPAAWGGHLGRELAGGGAEGLVAFRGAHRWLPGHEPLRLDAAAGAARLRPHGTYLITGGLGGVGLILAEFLARTVQAKLVLVSRHGLRESAAAPAGPAEAPRYAAFSRELDRLCAALARRYLAAASGGAGRGTRIARAEIIRRLGVKPPFGKFVDYLESILADDGQVRLEDGDLVWLADPAGLPSVADLAAATASAYPEFAGVLELLLHCAEHYPEALSGAVPAISVLYPEGRSDLLEAAGRRTARHSNQDAEIARLQELVERTLAGAGGRPVRILEVGVGDGILTGRIAPGLQGRNAEYVATDLSRAFVVKAEKAAAAAGLGFVSFGVLDIARDPAAQGYAPGSFDLVLALDVVHATPRLAATLRHLQSLLAPGGRLGLIEKVRDERWTNLVWGLAEGWWNFEDGDLRPRTPLLPADAWERLLRAGAFGRVTVFPQAAAARADADYALLVAEKGPAPDAPPQEGGAPAGGTDAGRAAAVRRLEALGAEVLVEEADVADLAQLRAAVGRARARFGAIHGVIHAAGLTAGPAVFNLLPEATAEQARALFRVKVTGAENLAAALDGGPLDFGVLISSNASVLGGLGLGAYAAANTLLGAVATEWRRRGAGAWISATWDGWPTEGSGTGAPRVQTSIDQFAMTRAEAEAAFSSVLSSPVERVIVSAGDLAARLRRWVGAGATEADAPAPSAGTGGTARLHARPAGAGPYVAPRTATERALAALWSELLGIEPVGAEDNFFDLEGDSLLGTQLMARVGKDFGAGLSVGAIFEAPTLAALAGRIERARAAGGGRPAPGAGEPLAPTEEEGTL
jgi:3-oxoacyl-(acyl-carrier-protein) synthase/SAM-dependent methyltransferase